MSDFKDRMISAVESGFATDATAYNFVADQYLSSYDDWRTWAKENGWRNPLVAPYFCTRCHWSENAHPRPDCDEFLPGSEDEVRAENLRRGFLG
jgi:hypothetical protein